MSRLGTRLQAWWKTWIARRLPPSPRVTLAHRSIFILPTRFGLFWLFFVLLLFLFGTNYQNNLVIGLAILQLSIFNTCIIYSYRNLAGMTLEAKTGPEAYAGETVLFPVLLSAKQVQHQVMLNYPANPVQTIARVDSQPQQTLIPVSNRMRGWIDPGRLRVETRYPLGLCRAWSYVDLANRQLAYATPLPNDTQLSAQQEGDDEVHLQQGRSTVGVDEFSTLKPYITGESLNQVAWKQLAQGRGMLTKQFEQAVSAPLWLVLPPNEEVERAISQLTWSVDQLSAKGKTFGLKLPQTSIPPANGESHRIKVLSALATYGVKTESRHG